MARLDGIALRHAGWREPTKGRNRRAAAELREAAGGRADLLAEVAGLLTASMRATWTSRGRGPPPASASLRALSSP